jgi:hypothetical protein
MMVLLTAQPCPPVGSLDKVVLHQGLFGCLWQLGYWGSSTADLDSFLFEYVLFDILLLQATAGTT